MSQKVTVGIPFYSGTKLEELRASVDSIIAQSLVPSEIHLIQDGPVSSHLTELVNHYVVNFPHVKHILIEHNSGLAHAINLSILSSGSPYYARMDSDDIAHPQRLEKQIEFLENHPDIDILGSWALEFKEDPFTEQGFIRQLPTQQSEIEAMFHYRNPFVHAAVTFRRSVFAKVGLYNTNFVDEDLELWSRAFQKGIKTSNLPEVLLYYRFSGSVQRRAERVLYHAKARYQFNTWSVKLNFLKVLSLLMKLMPLKLQEWAYENLR